ncbi:hypothetical protein HP568_06110 [Brevibacillus sp. MS2.2]|nr:hypothetical protein [Brevibacillus sp. MS2.2]
MLLIGQGELTNEVYSPNSQYVSKVYRVGDERGLRVDVNTGLFGSERLIYWSGKESEAKVEWLEFYAQLDIQYKEEFPPYIRVN